MLSSCPTVAGWTWPVPPHSQPFNKQAEPTATLAQGGHCPDRPRPAKCENFCSLRLHHAPNKNTRFHHDQRENGVAGYPHNRADIIGGLLLAAYKSQRQRESTAVIHERPNSAAATSGRTKTRQTRKSTTPQNSRQTQTLSST